MRIYFSSVIASIDAGFGDLGGLKGIDKVFLLAFQRILFCATFPIRVLHPTEL